MKLCWDNLDNLVLAPGPGMDAENPVLRYYENPKKQTGYLGVFDISDKACTFCGKHFLQKKNSNQQFCDNECSKVYKQSKIIPKDKLPDRRLKENGGGSWPHQPWNKGVKTGIENSNWATFDNFDKEISWFTKTRRAKEDERVLEVPCCICGEWFKPYRKRLASIIKYTLQGDDVKATWGLYCSNKCRDKCIYFGKSAEQIMKEDHLNNGKALFSERIKTPAKVLYYDWQEDIKKEIDKKQIIFERHKLRRRKKTELEKKRMSLKRATNKAKKEISEDPKTPRLKRMLYLAKSRSKQKGWDFDLDLDWLRSNAISVCPKSGLEIDYSMEIKMNPRAPSIDRVNSNKGYTKDNCIIVSWIYNCGKNCYTENILYKICKGYLDNL